MSLSRQFLRELRPFFRLFDETLTRPTTLSAFPVAHQHFFDDPFFRGASHPVVDIAEQDNNYVVEAELPGVKREDLSLSIGEGGRCLTIEGRVVDRSGPAESSAGKTDAEKVPDTSSVTEDSQAGRAVEPTQSNQLSSERTFVRNTAFSRTVFLPRPVDAGSVSAKLLDGVLTVRMRKAEDKARVDVRIE